MAAAWFGSGLVGGVVVCGGAAAVSTSKDGDVEVEQGWSRPGQERRSNAAPSRFSRTWIDGVEAGSALEARRRK
ncbi:hypothetical protein M0R45_025882 [Rubus argutus]|uniref:Secreted protein n=1 Tax=Rubus argutus TaxID=59490 RepID=A0AAW1WW01_RUBAR